MTLELAGKKRKRRKDISYITWNFCIYSSISALKSGYRNERMSDTCRERLKALRTNYT
jgi:hypothetical protein